MKKIATIIIALFLAIVIKAEQKVYVPDGSKFVLSEIGTSNKSIDDIVEVLGYNQVYTILGSQRISSIFFATRYYLLLLYVY